MNGSFASTIRCLFAWGFEQGGSRAVMAAYNSWNGTPMLIHPVLKDVMIKEWGNDGLICSMAAR